MWNWITSLFKNPKAIISAAVDALDLAAPFLAQEIDKIGKTFLELTSQEKAQWIIDKVQEFLRKKFSLDA